MSLLKHDPSQTVITDYYKTIDEVEKYARSTPQLMNIFSFSTDQTSSQSSDSIAKEKIFPPSLNK